MEYIELMKSVSDIIHKFIKGSERPLSKDEEDNLKKIIRITNIILGKKRNKTLALLIYRLILIIYSKERFYALKDKKLNDRERKEIIRIIDIQYSQGLLNIITPRQFQAIKEEIEVLRFKKNIYSQRRINFLKMLLSGYFREVYTKKIY